MMNKELATVLPYKYDHAQTSEMRKQACNSMKSLQNKLAIKVFILKAQWESLGP